LRVWKNVRRSVTFNKGIWMKSNQSTTDFTDKHG